MLRLIAVWAALAARSAGSYCDHTIKYKSSAVTSTIEIASDILTAAKAMPSTDGRFPGMRCAESYESARQSYADLEANVSRGVRPFTEYLEESQAFVQYFDAVALAIANLTVNCTADPDVWQKELEGVANSTTFATLGGYLANLTARREDFNPFLTGVHSIAYNSSSALQCAIISIAQYNDTLNKTTDPAKRKELEKDIAEMEQFFAVLNNTQFIQMSQMGFSFSMAYPSFLSVVQSTVNDVYFVKEDIESTKIDFCILKKGDLDVAAEYWSKQKFMFEVYQDGICQFPAWIGAM